MVIILSTISMKSVFFGRNAIAKEPSDNNVNVGLTLDDHDPILIDHDDDFTTLGFAGNGTEYNPYLIENLSIIAFGQPAMEIMFTTKFFEIRNCYINAPMQNIKLYSIASGTVKILNNIIDDSFAGIFVESTHNITFFNNSISYNFYGIDIRNSFNCNLSHNKFFDSIRYGIRADNAKSIQVRHNYFYNSGLEIRNLSLQEYLECLIIDNFVEDKPLAFITNTVDTVITTPDYGQIILVNCTNLNISNQILNNGGIGFHLIYCEQIALYNNQLYENFRGILIEESNKISVENNTIRGNAYFGIEFTQSDYCQFVNNTFYDQSTCIRLVEGSSAWIHNNSFIECSASLFIYNTSSTIITNNTFFKCQGRIIYLVYTNYSFIAHNIIQISDLGFVLKDSHFNVFYHNLIQECVSYAVSIGENSHNNTLYLNTFFENNHLSDWQAEDFGLNNCWYNETTHLGNYWSDWSGTGSYSIGGSSSSVDLYPLLFPSITPLIDEFSMVLSLPIFLLLVSLTYLILKVKHKKMKKLVIFVEKRKNQEKNKKAFIFNSMFLIKGEY